MCSRYYSEFLVSVQELLAAKSRSASLKEEISLFDEDIKRTGQDMLKIGNELQRQKTDQRHIQIAAVVAAQCHDLTLLLAKAKQQIEEGRHYPALRTLDSISQQLRVAVQHPFVDRVESWLPALAVRLKSSALQDVSDWLVAIRGKSTSIGKGVLRKCVGYLTGQAACAGTGLGGFLGAPALGALDARSLAPTPAELLLRQTNQVTSFSAWVKDELLQALPYFRQAPAGDEQHALSSLAESLGPLHRALHIHAHLGALDELQLFYVNNRLPQASLPSGGSLPAPSSTAAATERAPSPGAGREGPDERAAQLQEAMAYYAGFFVTEHAAIRSTEHPGGLIPVFRLEEAWRGLQRDVCAQLEAVIAATVALPEARSPALLLQLKQTALLLASTLGEDCFRFDTRPLMETLRGPLREGFQAAEELSVDARCRLVLEQQEFQPLSVTCEEEYRSLVLPYGLDWENAYVLEGGADVGEQGEGRGGESEESSLVRSAAMRGYRTGRTSRRGGTKAGRGSRYPRAFPFSVMVPRLSRELYRTASLCFLYGLQLQHPAAMETTLLVLIEKGFATVRRLLDEELAGAGGKAADIPISKACQVSIDAMALARVTTAFEAMLIAAAAHFFNSTEAASKSIPAILGAGRRALEDTSIAAQHLVYELIQKKIDELLEGMCFIEWEPTKLASEARSYVEDVVSYLQVTFMCLTYMPKEARDGLHFASCTHIHAVMLATLLNPHKVRAVNTTGLYNLSLDVAALEAFADACGVLQLRECFAELHQTLGALLHQDIHTLMLDASLREGVFPKIRTANLVNILERYKPLGLLAQVKNQQGGAGHGGGGRGVDLPYLDKKKAAEYIKSLRKQLQEERE